MTGSADRTSSRAELLYVEDLSVGDTRELGWFSLSTVEMIEFARRFDPAPFHVDERLAGESLFGGIVASGLHTLSMVYRLVYDGLISQLAVAAGRRVTMQMPAPVRPDERIDARATMTEVRNSPTRANFGIVVITAEATNPAGSVVMIATLEALVKRRTAPGEDRETH